MPGDPEENDENWLRPVWETEDEAEPPGSPRMRRPVVEPDFAHPLLQPLARAQDAVARLETRAETASGWLAHVHIWIHPHDLALRDRGLTGSYGAAFRAGRLEAELPSTAAGELTFETSPSDIMVDQALRLARLWRRLAELRTWRPLANAETVQEALQSLGAGLLSEADIEEWFAAVDGSPAPLLVRAGHAARDWMNRPGVEPRSPVGMFLAAAFWREKGSQRPVPLPFWSAPELRHHWLGLHVGLGWMADFLDCIAAAAKIGLDELERLQRAEEKSRSLGRTARSRLPDAVEVVLRTPIVTARDLAGTLDVTPQAALGLLHQLVDSGLIREATGRASWRAFSLK